MGERVMLYSFDFMNQDIKCATICVYNDNTVTTENYISDIVDLPFGVLKEGLTWDDLDEFLEWRCVPRGRANIRSLLADMNIQFYNPIEIVRKTHGVMCDDTYWVRFSGEDLCWKDVNPLLKV